MQTVRIADTRAFCRRNGSASGSAAAVAVSNFWWQVKKVPGSHDCSRLPSPIKTRMGVSLPPLVTLHHLCGVIHDRPDFARYSTVPLTRLLFACAGLGLVGQPPRVPPQTYQDRRKAVRAWAADARPHGRIPA